MKNAERNLDSRDDVATNTTSWHGLCYSTSSFDYSYRPLRRLLFTSILGLGLLMIGLSLRAHLPSNCQDPNCSGSSPSAEAQSRLRRETRWTKIYQSISKCIQIDSLQRFSTHKRLIKVGFLRLGFCLDELPGRSCKL